MANTSIAVTDSPFPSLDPAKKALAKFDPEYRMSKSPSADDILGGGARRRRGAGHLRQAAGRTVQTVHALQGDRPLRPRRRQHRPAGGEGVGIAVNYVPDYCLREVSDHAMALLLALARKVPFSNKLVQSGRWEVPPITPLRRLEGQVLGLIGFGNIPRALAPKAKAFGLKVITHDPYVSPEVLRAAGVEGRASTSCWRARISSRCTRR